MYVIVIYSHIAKKPKTPGWEVWSLFGHVYHAATLAWSQLAPNNPGWAGCASPPQLQEVRGGMAPTSPAMARCPAGFTTSNICCTQAAGGKAEGVVQKGLLSKYIKSPLASCNTFWIFHRCPRCYQDPNTAGWPISLVVIIVPTGLP